MGLASRPLPTTTFEKFSRDFRENRLPGEVVNQFDERAELERLLVHLQRVVGCSDQCIRRNIHVLRRLSFSQLSNWSTCVHQWSQDQWENVWKSKADQFKGRLSPLRPRIGTRWQTSEYTSAVQASASLDIWPCNIYPPEFYTDVLELKKEIFTAFTTIPTPEEWEEIINKLPGPIPERKGGIIPTPKDEDDEEQEFPEEESPPPPNEPPVASDPEISDPTPPPTGFSFNAVYTDPEGVAATAHQVQVSGVSDFVSIIWDTGMVVSPGPLSGIRSVEYPYEGPALTNSVTFFFRVRFWDDVPQPSNYTSLSFTIEAVAVPDEPEVSDVRVSAASPDVGDLVNGNFSFPVQPEFLNLFYSDPGLDNMADYRIEVSTDAGFSVSVWDTGVVPLVVASDTVFYVAWGGPILDEATPYFFRFTVRDEFGFTNSPLLTAFAITETITSPLVSAMFITDDFGLPGEQFPGFGFDPLSPLWFSAFYDDPEGGEPATQYELSVGSATLGFLWESGLTAFGPVPDGTRTPNLPYGGAQLLFGESYTARIRVFDSGGEVSNFTSMSFFMEDAPPSNDPPVVSDLHFSTGPFVAGAPPAGGSFSEPFFVSVFYTDPDGDPGFDYQIQIATDSGFGSIVFDTGSASFPGGPAFPPIRSEAIEISGTGLSLFVTYFIRMRITEAYSGFSNWTSDSYFLIP